MNTRQKMTLLPLPIGVAIVLCWCAGALTRDEIWFRAAGVLFLPLGLLTLFVAFRLRQYPIKQGQYPNRIPTRREQG